jgi:predicted nuclease of predicted toxin-antitoxin system
VRFLIDANLSPRLAILLASEGHDAVAVRQVGLSEAPDNEIVDYAANDDRIVVSHDTDFGALLAFRGLTKPSFILFRSSDPITPDEQTNLIISNLDAFAGELESGAIVVFAKGRLRIRRLPVL